MKFIIDVLDVRNYLFDSYDKKSANTKSILTDRLTLDKITMDDHDFILSIVNSKGWIENIGDRNIHSKDEAIEYINKILWTENFIYWVVRTKKDRTRPLESYP